MLSLVMPADAALMRYARHLAERWLEELSEEARGDMVLALGEALANAVEHGSPLGAFNRIRLRLYRDERRCVLEVKDEGSGFDPDRIPDLPGLPLAGVRSAECGLRNGAAVWSNAPPGAEVAERGYGVGLMRRVAHARWDEGGTRVRLSVGR